MILITYISNYLLTKLANPNLTPTNTNSTLIATNNNPNSYQNHINPDLIPSNTKLNLTTTNANTSSVVPLFLCISWKYILINSTNFKSSFSDCSQSIEISSNVYGLFFICRFFTIIRRDQDFLNLLNFIQDNSQFLKSFLL